MNDLKRYGIIIAVVLAVFVLNFNISGERGDVKSFRGAQLEDQIRGAADAGVQEWLLWNASNNYDSVKSGL